MSKKPNRTSVKKRAAASRSKPKTDLAGIELRLVKSLRAFAQALPMSVQLGGAAEEARLGVIAASGDWLTAKGADFV